jgi:hypothetical protein
MDGKTRSCSLSCHARPLRRGRRRARGALHHRGGRRGRGAAARVLLPGLRRTALLQEPAAAG